MEPNVYDKIQDVDLKNTMESSYLDYSMSVIVSRALPDVRDGLKPVQRRILYALHTLGLTSDKKTKKCATIVGETMGKYHPHGDSSIYGALVGMGQPWNYRKVLIENQGNFGSEDGDSPAAMRYTEAKMSKICDFMLDGINKNEVDLIPNFSNEYDEPVVLPARFPNLLVNGTTGIAVGMATNIPPHNFTEVINAVVKIIDDKIFDKVTTIDDILNIIKGPDFPTGATIVGKRGIKEYLTTGRGRVVMKATTEIVTLDNGKQKIIVKELPYQVHRSELIAKIADLVKDKKIEGITHILDTYGKKATSKIEIEIKKEANPNVILNKLMKMTALESSFAVTMLCIVDGSPKTLDVLSMLNEFLKHQVEVVERRTKFDLNKAEERAHIVEGLLKAIDIIDEVIKTIRESNDPEEARNKLVANFGFSERQAESIVEMRLKALTSLEAFRLKEEYDELTKKISYFKEILADPKKLLSVIKDEILEIEKKEHDERKTQIVKEETKELEEEDLIEEKNIIVTMTHLGYIKRMDDDTFRSQKRGGVGVKGMTTLENDFIEEVFTTSNVNTLMFITNQGRMYTIKGHEIPEANRTARGTAIINLLKLKPGEKVTTGVDIKKDDDQNKYLIMATKKGIVKKVNLTEFNNVRTAGTKAINIKEDDELIACKLSTGKDDMILITKNGLLLRFNESKIREMGRNSAGVKGINITKDDELKSLLLSNEGKEVLIVSENGIGKRVNVEEFSAKGRGGKGMTCYKPSEKTGKLVGAELVNGDEDVMLINEKGLVIRTNVKNISLMGRTAKGVLIMKSEDGSKIASITKMV